MRYRTQRRIALLVLLIGITLFYVHVIDIVSVTCVALATVILHFGVAAIIWVLTRTRTQNPRKGACTT